MPQTQRIAPNLEFIKNLQAAGGDTVKRCYQCATCSVACPLSPQDGPFPRKEMVWAQWGLKDKLLSDIDLWLCHRCGNCSDLCPRGAKPGDVLAAARSMVYRELVGPKFLGEWMSAPKHLPKLLAIPAVLFAFIWLIVAGFGIPEGKIVYGKLFPGDYTIDPIFCLTFAFVVYTFYKGVRKLFAEFDKGPKTVFIGPHKKVGWLQAIREVILEELITHNKWKDCGETPGDQARFKGHFYTFFAFIALAIVTGVIAVSHWGPVFLPFLHFLEPMGHTPLPLYNPVKLLANVGAVMLIIGLLALTKRRMNLDKSRSTSSYSDWFLLGVIWAVALTGIGSQLLRWVNWATLAYFTYYLHLISVFMLIAYLPWSKLGHLVYRTAALVYTRVAGRLPMPAVADRTFHV
ncbi:quinone-interacting membrane-bound oxidoreductase complex subunit QmoC [Megalodesulfovibrio paquesii]